MSGRFFTMPFLVAVMMLLEIWRGRDYQRAAAAALVLYNVLIPLVPVKTTGNYDAGWAWRSQNGIKDERGHYHRSDQRAVLQPVPQLTGSDLGARGHSFRNGPDKVTVQGSIGFYGLFAGPEKHLVDRNALSDPLLARLPVSPRLYFEFYSGHIFRDIPDGYLETVSSGQNRLADPLLHAYYEQLQRVLRDPLLSAARLRSIWYLNAGRGPSPGAGIRAAAADRPVDPRRQRTLRGRRRGAGRCGRGHPLGRPRRLSATRARHPDEARRLQRPLDWHRGERPDRRIRVRRRLGRWRAHRAPRPRRQRRAADSRRIAEIGFTLPAPTTHLEYRFWIDGRAAVTLERVELSSRVPDAAGRGRPGRSDRPSLRRAPRSGCDNPCGFWPLRLPCPVVRDTLGSHRMATNTFRLQYLAKAAAGVPRDLVNTFVSAKLHPIRPTVLIYNCTWVCDARCTMCNNWKWGDRKSDMTLAQLEPVMAHPFWGAVENLNISGGEPTTRNDLPEMVRAVPSPSPAPAQDRHQHHRADAAPRHPDADADRRVLRREGHPDQHPRVARRHRRHPRSGARRQERLREGQQDHRGDAGAGHEARQLPVRHRRDDLRDQHGGCREHPGLGADQGPRRRLQHAAVHRRDAAQQGARGEDRLPRARRSSSCASSSSTASRKSRC